MSNCTACDVGTYMDGVGASQCYDCPTGYFAPEVRLPVLLLSAASAGTERGWEGMCLSLALAGTENA
jgi:hypothetical protein